MEKRKRPWGNLMVQLSHHPMIKIQARYTLAIRYIRNLECLRSRILMNWALLWCKPGWRTSCFRAGSFTAACLWLLTPIQTPKSLFNPLPRIGMDTEDGIVSKEITAVVAILDLFLMPDLENYPVSCIWYLLIQWMLTRCLHDSFNSLSKCHFYLQSLHIPSSRAIAWMLKGYFLLGKSSHWVIRLHQVQLLPQRLSFFRTCRFCSEQCYFVLYQIALLAFRSWGWKEFAITSSPDSGGSWCGFRNGTWRLHSKGGRRNIFLQDKYLPIYSPQPLGPKSTIPKSHSGGNPNSSLSPE